MAFSDKLQEILKKKEPKNQNKVKVETKEDGVKVIKKVNR